VLLIVALLAATGAHWTLLQTVAWTNMLADNLETCSFTEALTKTFDGKHPCALCKAIAAGKKSEKKKEFTVQSQKLEFPPFKANFTLIAPPRPKTFPPPSLFAVCLPHRPPTPPPRALFV
jgi:hypothetical protein